VLFVSHNMGAIGRLCTRGMLLDQGRLLFSGDVMQAIATYMQGVACSSAELAFEPDDKKKMQVRAVKLIDHSGKPSTELDRVYPFTITIDYHVQEKITGAHVGIMLDRIDGIP